MTQTILFNEVIIKRFAQVMKGGHLAHAYLFVGPSSIGKSETALALAKLVNCQNIKNDLFCDACPSCIKITNGNHPDVHVIVPEEEKDTVSIEQIRQMISRVQLRPFEAEKKVFIIKNAETLTLEASNTLLKTLEEPTPKSLIILTSAFADRILETIKSRCHRVHFYPVANEVLEQYLIKNHRLDKSAAHFLAYFAEGAPGKAMAFNRQKTFERKNDIINQFLYVENSEPFLQGLVVDKEKTKEALDLLLSLFRDLMLLKLEIDEPTLIHVDRAKDLRTLQKKYTFEELCEAVGEIVRTSKLLGDNFNMKIALTLIKERLWKK